MSVAHVAARSRNSRLFWELDRRRSAGGALSLGSTLANAEDRVSDNATVSLRLSSLAPPRSRPRPAVSRDRAIIESIISPFLTRESTPPPVGD
jgi:hypothetical protein